jgi:hypothetical protein
VTSKRRKGFPSETKVKRGQRVVHGNKHLNEKLGRNDPCLCGSARSFQALLLAKRLLLTEPFVTTTTASERAFGPIAQGQSRALIRLRSVLAGFAREHHGFPPRTTNSQESCPSGKGSACYAEAGAQAPHRFESCALRHLVAVPFV